METQIHYNRDNTHRSPGGGDRRGYCRRSAGAAHDLIGGNAMAFPHTIYRVEREYYAPKSREFWASSSDAYTDPKRAEEEYNTQIKYICAGADPKKVKLEYWIKKSYEK